MKQINRFLTTTALAMATLAPLTGFAQAPQEQGKMGMTTAPSMTDGEVRKIDKAAGKLTIKHGEIKHMDMPGMTMVFVAKDKAILDTLKVGDKIRFMVINESGKMVVTDIEPAK